MITTQDILKNIGFQTTLDLIDLHCKKKTKKTFFFYQRKSAGLEKQEGE